VTERALPPNWAVTTLGQIAANAPNAIVDGPFGSNLKVSDYVEYGVPVLQGKNITADSLSWFGVRFISAKKAEELKRSSVRVGDILLVKIGSIGYAAIIRDLHGFESAIIPANLAKITPDPEIIDTLYLHKWLTSPDAKRYFKSIASKTAQPALSLGKIKNLIVPLPPLPEQRRISEILDRAEALREKRRDAIAELDVLVQDIFFEMFGDPALNSNGWERVPFYKLLTKIDSGWSPRCLDRPASGEQWGVLKLGAVTWCEFNPGENKALPPDVAAVPGLEVQTGDILFTRKNTPGLIAACALVGETPPRLLIPDLIFRFRLDADAMMDAHFLHRLLTYPTKRREVQKLASGSAGSMPNISKARLRNVLIERPPLALQREFARRVAAAEELKASCRVSLHHLNGLFASLQHEAFRGGL
jgi:type I restriction enzyme, S subunit